MPPVMYDLSVSILVGQIFLCYFLLYLSLCFSLSSFHSLTPHLFHIVQGDVDPMPAASMKPTSRLLLRVLGEEAKKENPFAAPLDIRALLADIHGTYVCN